MKASVLGVLLLLLCGCSMFGVSVEPVAPGIRITSEYATNSIPASTIGAAVTSLLSWCGVNPVAASAVSGVVVVGIGVAGWWYKRKAHRTPATAAKTSAERSAK